MNHIYKALNPIEPRVKELGKLHQIFLNYLTEHTDQTGLQFTSSFSRLSYLITTNLWSKKASFLLHSFRKAHQLSHNYSVEDLIRLGEWASQFLVTSKIAPIETTALYEIFKIDRPESITFEPLIEVIITDILLDTKRMIVQRIDEPYDKITVTYGDPERNEDYTPIIEDLAAQGLLPIQAVLHEVQIAADGLHSPSKIILDSDFLHVVTSVSECFSAFGTTAANFMLRKVMPHKSSPALIMGNVANHFLDRLIYEPQLEFKTILQEVFNIDVLGLSLMSDAEVRSILLQFETHFQHLKKTVNIDLADQGLQAESIYIEPTFYATQYGLQGRLDVFYISGEQASIVELKSGKPFKTNTYGLNSNHYHQTLLYDMLIESVFGFRMARKNFILYSKEANNALRFAPTLKVQQRETILQRNKLYLLDRRLERSGDIKGILAQILEQDNKALKGYVRTDIQKAITTLKGLDDIEYEYVKQVFQHLCKERFDSKVGETNNQRSRGLASLWRDTVTQKVEQFNIINHLNIKENYCGQPDPLMILSASDLTAQLHNFRIGDLCILYPDQGGTSDILSEQVFKVTLLEIKIDQIAVRLRSRQMNLKIFESYKLWHIEHDRLDNGFTSMSRSAYEFATHSLEYRRSILQRDEPPIPDDILSDIEYITEMTGEQNELYREVINATGYHLLWGPPGTGKTSIMLRYLTKYYLEKTQQRILLLAYTNRAVDEICTTINHIDEDIDFIRIGSRYSTHADFRSHLLNERLSQCANRNEVIETLSSQRLYTGTIASILGKSDLFRLLSFDLVMIDEASQVLDAQLIGLLGRFKKFVLIGDHKQLPAVTHQSLDQSIIEHQELNDLGITNLSNSLFERMYLHAVNKGWTHVYGQLSQQGRMHQDLMAFANEQFYDNTLNILPNIDRLTAELPEADTVFRSHRLIYYNTDVDIESNSLKINQSEAQACKLILEGILLSGSENSSQQDLSIGIITPYRAQIACIRQVISTIDHPIIADITIDTVERYQGSARDVIILSTCVNYPFQLRSLQSLSDQGIDRKLNVAFTRAREQFILVGNRDILSQSNSYRHLIGRSYEY